MSILNRREFVKSAAGAAVAAPVLMSRAGALSSVLTPDAESRVQLKITSFDYDGVRLLDGMLKRQYDRTRDYYYNIPNDDALLGYRRRAGLPAPGHELPGWYGMDIGNNLPQWLSAMARMYKATGDKAVLDKAVYLMTEWAKCIEPDGYFYYSKRPFPVTYSYDKTVCGLVDLYHYAGQKEALSHLEKITDWAIKNLVRTNPDPTPEHPDAGTGPPFNEENRLRPLEWYTLSENLYRAYQFTGNPKYKTFGDLWRYPHYWNMFNGQQEPRPYMLHAYSHCNTLSSAAMTYAVTGDPEYLKIIVNAYDWFDKTQFYATGGYGPTERILPPDGALGRFLERTTASFETPCGTWAGFKWAKYLMQFTGEARYGDWIERLVYNGIGAALPMSDEPTEPSRPLSGRGQTFYYSDYSIGAGRKVYSPTRYPCCAGTYPQAVADHHDLIYFKDASSLYVNLYAPSQVTWNHEGSEVRVEQETTYPESQMTTFRIDPSATTVFSLKFRVPLWSQGTSIDVNGAKQAVAVQQGAWASVERRWRAGDVVKVSMPMKPRLVPVDKQHPDRVAVSVGPVVLVREMESKLIVANRDPSTWLQNSAGLEYLAAPPGNRPFVPFYSVGNNAAYRMYFDLETRG